MAPADAPRGSPACCGPTGSCGQTAARRCRGSTTRRGPTARCDEQHSPINERGHPMTLRLRCGGPRRNFSTRAGGMAWRPEHPVYRSDPDELLDATLRLRQSSSRGARTRTGWHGGSEMRQDIRVEATLGLGLSRPFLVGDWYLHSRSAHHDPQVIEAYQATASGNGSPLPPPHSRPRSAGGPGGVHPLCASLRRRRRTNFCGTHRGDTGNDLCRHCRRTPSSSLRLCVRRRVGPVSRRARPHRPCLVWLRFRSSGRVHGLEDARPPAQWSGPVRSGDRALWSERRSRRHRRASRPQSVAPRAIVRAVQLFIPPMTVGQSPLTSYEKDRRPDLRHSNVALAR